MEPVQITTVPIGTEGGAAQAELDGDGAAPRFLLVLTHGAGGSAAAPDLLAARDAALPLGPLVQGGRSNGARVACRTAAAVGARAVIALAFPLRPPRRPVSTSRAMTSGA